MAAASISSQPYNTRQSSSAMNHNSLANCFDFRTLDKYQAQGDLLCTRSKTFSVSSKPRKEDIWSRKPPDFRPQNYLPNPPKRNTRDSMQPWKYFAGTKGTLDNLTVIESEVTLPKVLQPKRPKSSKMVLKFDIINSDEARMLYVKKGVYPKGQYSNPMPHDFRQYPELQQLGLPEFETSKSPDPLNIRFRSKNLDIHHGVPQPLQDEYMGDQMGHPLGLQPKYEPDLILPRQKWPNIPQEYTRYRPRVRTPHTALLDTIEDKLTKQWAVEKAERKRQQRAFEKQQREERLQRDIKKGIAEAVEKKRFSNSASTNYKYHGDRFSERSRTVTSASSSYR